MSDYFVRDPSMNIDQSPWALQTSAGGRINVSRLADELIVIASHVAKLSHKNSQYIFASTTELLGEIRRMRSLRHEFFADDLFADPAWDILLELKHAENEQIKVTISQLCIAAAVPATTALRWITNLVEKGMLIRNDDRFDHRRTFISLHPGTSEAMERYFGSVVERQNVKEGNR